MFTLLHPDTLQRLDESPDVEDAALEVFADRDDYCTDDGDGVWIGRYLVFLEDLARERGSDPAFTFSDDARIDEDLFNEIQDPYLRSLLIRFTNASYETWRDKDVDLPEYGDVRNDCRDYCDEVCRVG